MYEIKISINPEYGVKDVALQTTDKHKDSLEPMAFYLRVREDIQRFKKNIAKTLTRNRRELK